MMKHKKAKFAAVGGAAAVIAIVSASAAMATSQSFTASSGTVGFSAAGVSMGCTSSSASGTVDDAAGNDPVASITSMVFNGCFVPGGAATVTMTSSPWDLHPDYSTFTSGTSDDGDGYVDGVAAHVETTANPAICSFDVTGLAVGDFDETTQTLNVNEVGDTGNLVLSNVSGCLGALHNGDPANFTASYALTTATPVNVQP